MAVNVESSAALKSSVKFSGYHTFYRNVAASIKESLPDADLGVMSKTAATMWKKCSSYVRQDWKNKGQSIREDIDCGIVDYKCKKCEKSFPRAKDARYHEKFCGHAACTICSRTFLNQHALKRHIMAVHEEKYKCQTCQKVFAGSSSLKHHQKIHSGMQRKDFPCHMCNCKFTTKSNMKRHVKSHVC